MDVDHFWELLLDVLNKADAASLMNERYGRHLQEAGQEAVATAAAVAAAVPTVMPGAAGGVNCIELPVAAAAEVIWVWAWGRRGSR